MKHTIKVDIDIDIPEGWEVIPLGSDVKGSDMYLLYGLSSYYDIHGTLLNTPNWVKVRNFSGNKFTYTEPNQIVIRKTKPNKLILNSLDLDETGEFNVVVRTNPVGALVISYPRNNQKIKITPKEALQLRDFLNEALEDEE